MSKDSPAPASSWFQRFVLPGLAFKAVVIGGGYATGRELAEFFLPSGPRGGLLGMLTAMVFWSAICAITFALAQTSKAFDYRDFFKSLLGRAWVVFEVAYLLIVILILSVFGAAAGAIGEAVFGWPKLVGTLALGAAIAAFATFGNASVERLFKYVSFLLYGTYAVYIALTLFHFHGAIAANLGGDSIGPGWLMGGLTYASYNVVGAVVVLPVVRHLQNRREAVIAGLLAGPLAMLPALLFFIGMLAFYPQIGAQALPSDFVLKRLGSPAFHLFFQGMIFCALLESSAGSVHAVNERLAAAWRSRFERPFPAAGRALAAGAILVLCLFAANRFGLVALISKGYRLLAYTILAVYIGPLLIVGVPRLLRSARGTVLLPGKSRPASAE